MYTARYYAREYADFRLLRRNLARHGFTHTVAALGSVLAGIRRQWASAKNREATLP